MVLTNQLYLVLVLLVLLTCGSSTTTTTTNFDTAPTTTPPNSAPTPHESSSEDATGRPQSRTPKTEPKDQTYILGTTSTERPDERRKIEDKTRHDNGRSLDINEKFNIPDFHSENDVVSESKSYDMEISSKTANYEAMFRNAGLTTPKSEFFDSKHKSVQEEVSRAIDEKEKMVTVGLEHDHKYFYSKAPEFSKPPENEYRIEEFKRIESNESKNKNKIHKDYTVETGKKTETVRTYNETKIIDEPKKDVSQNEVKDERKGKQPNDLDQEPSDQIVEVHVEKNEQQPLVNSSLNKEQLDPIIPNDKDIIVTKRGPKIKHKTTTPMVNLEDTNVVEVTTKGNRMESYDMKMINVINDNKTIISTTEGKLARIEEETTTKEAETTTIEQETSSVDNTETTEAFEITTQIEEDLNSTETTETQTVETTTSGSFDESGTNFGDLLEQILTNSTEVPPDTTITTTVKFYGMDDEDEDTTFYEAVTTEKSKPYETKKNETVSNIANEIFKSPFSSTESNEVKTISPPIENATATKVYNTTKMNENEIIKQNEINVLGDKSSKASTTEEPIEKDCYLEQCEENEEDYGDPNGSKKNQELEDTEETSEKVLVNYDVKVTVKPLTTTSDVDSNNIEPRTFNLSTPRFRAVGIDVDVTTSPAGLVDDNDEEEDGNGGKIAAIVISTVGAVCLLLLVGLLIVMRKRQKRFNYGQRCRPVSLDAYSMDNVSIHNSTRRKGVLMTSKRAYGNAAFDDPNSPSHLLTFSELVKVANNTEDIHNEFEEIPQVQAKTSELPEGCEVKNRYANVIPLPETRVFLSSADGDPTSDYINANFVTGAKSERRYYIACQAPLQNTIGDFWRMIWEQESKVVLMLTHLYEHGVEKCIDYLPPSEVLDCHRLFGDFQVTLKKREVRDKYIISSLQLKNMVSNSWREVTHIWYIEWPHKGVPDEANSLIRFLIEARSYMKVNEIKIREANTSFIQGSTPRNPPVVVHCSPGTGRTGTVIACDIAIREFEQSRQVDVPKIVYKIRRDRASSVQTKEQYSFIYKVINLYATKLTGGAFDSF